MHLSPSERNTRLGTVGSVAESICCNVLGRNRYMALSNHRGFRRISSFMGEALESG